MDPKIVLISQRIEESQNRINLAIRTVSPFTVPISSLMVKTSSRACVGCSPIPSPAFSTGTLQCLAANYNEQECLPALCRTLSDSVPVNGRFSYDQYLHQ